MAAKRRLGKGLGALIPDEDEEVFWGGEAGKKRYREIEVDKIRPNPYQPRVEYDPVSMDELKNSIAEKGVIQPVTVREGDGYYELIAGERRLRAVKELGFEKIPAFLVEVESEEEMLELALIENIQREDLNPVDVARGYRRLIDELHLTQEEVAQKVGKERSTVTNFLRLLKLPNPILESLRAGTISMGHARALLSVAEPEQQMALWKKTVAQKWSVREVEARVRRTGKKPPRAPERPRPKSPFVEAMEEKFREILGTKVKIHSQGDRGKIEIDYYSKEDLERIWEILNGEDL